MARIWIISDTHFGHANMYKFTNRDGNRVRAKFAHVKEGDEYMADMWAQLVQPPDHIYHLGDVAFGDAALQLVKKLPGHKRLVLGNHDPDDMKKLGGVGFQKIFGVRLPLMGQVIASHVPIHPDSIAKWAIGNIHGHIHERRVLRDGILDLRYFNASVEQIDYRPMDLEAILEQMKEYQR